LSVRQQDILALQDRQMWGQRGARYRAGTN
jgi:hypothetical protein